MEVVNIHARTQWEVSLAVVILVTKSLQQMQNTAHEIPVLSSTLEIVQRIPILTLVAYRVKS